MNSRHLQPKLQSVLKRKHILGWGDGSPWKCEDRSLDLQNPCKNEAAMVATCNGLSLEAEMGSPGEASELERPKLETMPQ